MSCSSLDMKPGWREACRRDIPEVWRRSIAEAVAVVAMLMLDRRLIPLEQELRPPAGADPRLQLLVTIPGAERPRSQPSPTAEQPVASALPRRQAALRRERQPRQGRSRPQGPDRDLARPRAATAHNPLRPRGAGADHGLATPLCGRSLYLRLARDQRRSSSRSFRSITWV
jgi:hypothetical protein